MLGTILVNFEKFFRFAYRINDAASQNFAATSDKNKTNNKEHTNFIAILNFFILNMFGLRMVSTSPKVQSKT